MKSLIYILLFSYGLLQAQETSGFFSATNGFLKTYVENGKVKYAEIKQNPKQLDELLNQAKKFKPDSNKPEEFKAFWINAYNLAVIYGILEKYPVSSPLDIDGFFEIRRHSLGQQSVTLDEIEHKILFKSFPEEERFHFVLVCAARSCPPLIAEAYNPEILENQLETQTRKALNDPEFIKLKNNKVLLSEIMKWFKEDFTKDGKSLIGYINQYRTDMLPEDLETGFYEYNRKLNEL